MKKRLLSVILICSLLFAVILPVSAIKYGDTSNMPSGYWATWTTYSDALKTKNSAKIAAAGVAVINFWLDGKTAEVRAAEWGKNVAAYGYEINQVWSVSRTVAENYESLGDTKNAIKIHEISFAFVDTYKALLYTIPGKKPDDMEFARTSIQNKLKAYDAVVELYAELPDTSGTTSFKGAPHEPRTGIYFGEPSGVSMVTGTPKKTAATLIYVQYEGEDMERRLIHDIDANEKNGYKLEDFSLIEVAWNFKNEGSSLKGVLNDREKITKAAKYLASLGNVPILLRIGAEMNVWKNAADPKEFIAAFRFIADIVRKEAPNVGLIWSVNSVSSQGLTYDMFYPGDAYVDWVGVSLYTSRYFVGREKTDDETAAMYGTGKYANPVAIMEELVRQYGSRKPIIVTEGGVSLRNKSNNEDLTAWAIPRMRAQYAYIPMLFPQVKAMFWFNVVRNEAQIWDFSASSKAKELYGKLTAGDYFIGKSESASQVTYQKVGSSSAIMPANSVKLNTYASYFTLDSVTVQYKLDGKWIGQSADIPYRQVFDWSKLSEGAHKLEITVLDGKTQLSSGSYNVYKHQSDIVVSTAAITKPASVKYGTTVTPQLPNGEKPKEEKPSAQKQYKATPTASSLYINKTHMQFDAYNIDGNNYFKLRDLACSISGSKKQFEIGWDGKANAISLTRGRGYTKVGGELTYSKNTKTKTPVVTTSKIIIDGKEVELVAYNIDGNNYFKLRDIGKAFNFAVDWDGDRNAISIDTDRDYKD